MAKVPAGLSEKQVSLVDHLVNILEKNSRGFEIVTYGVASIGLLTALNRIRPFAKFSNPRKVPSYFIEKQTVLRGTAVRIEPGKTALILVDHKPLINIPRFGESKYLPVKIAGVNVTNHGISWLSTIVQGNKVEFLPVGKTDKYLDCTVIMLQEHREPLQIGKELVGLGFGTVEEIPSKSKSKLISSYERTLVTAQKWAKFKRNGYWHFTIPPTLWWRITNLLYEKLSLRSWYQAPL